MEIKEILSHIDHTMLSAEASWEEIKETLDEAIQFGAASAFIPPSYVKEAKEYVGSALHIGTVVGFPFGYSTTATKVYETADAVKNGADEIDMVINLGWVKNQEFALVREEIDAIRVACSKQILKVIVETSALTQEELLSLCRIVTTAKADYIKTSTGLAAAGATPENVLLMTSNVGPEVKVKAAGGIRTLDEAAQYLSLGARRIGSSQIIKNLANAQK